MKVVERMLEFEEYKQKLSAIKPSLDLLRGALKLDAAEREIEELEAASAREGFWNDVEKSQKVQKRLKTLQNKRDNYNRLCASWDDLMTLCDMAIEEGDDSLLEELQTDYAAFEEPAPAGPRRRTGRRCCTGCTTCGRTATAIRSG